MNSADSSKDSRSLIFVASPGRIVTVGVAALIAGVIAVYVTRACTQIVYRGQVTARVVTLTAPQDGLLSKWLIREGDHIHIGDTIALITNASIAEQRRELECEIARLRVERDRALAQAELDLEWRTKDVNAEIFAARLQSAELLEEKYRHEMEKVALADVLTNNSTALWLPKDTVFDSIVLQDSDNQQGRLSAVLRVEALSNSADVCSAQVEICEEQVASLEALRDSLPERVRRSAGVDVAERQLALAEDKLEQLSAESAQVAIPSTIIGQAGVFLHRPGDYVRMGDRIVEILDDVQRYIVVDVPSHEIDRFRLRDEVTVLFPGNVKRTGRVTNIAPQAVPAPTGTGTVVKVQLEPAGLLWPHVPLDSQVSVKLR